MEIGVKYNIWKSS